MSYKKHVQVVPVNQRLQKALARSQRYFDTDQPAGSSNKFASYLPEIYAGHPMRIERYEQYDSMDQDSEVNSALDTIADFSTRKDKQSDEVFRVTWRKEPSETETQILKKCLRQWCKVNEFKKRAWRIFRSTIKYGDQFFIRDPETLEWYWIDPVNVEKVLVNEARGKEPEAYLIRNLDLNLQTLTGTPPSSFGSNLAGGAGTGALQQKGPIQSQPFGGMGAKNPSRFGAGDQDLVAVDATHVVHISMTEGMDRCWPFGTSILESVFKVYRQKELLEDAIIIYRIQRAPERRVFHIDVGNMPVHKAGAYLERLKNEIHQRRFPTRAGGGSSVVDATYNPMSMMEDFFFARTSDGRGSNVETLPGGDNLGQIDDLKFWSNKLLRGLRVPTSYLPTGPEDGQMVFIDGRVGTAYIQEFRFAQYCERLQNLIISTFDDEFKLFVRRRGYNISAADFELNFHEPQSFNEFAQMEKDAAMINIFAPLAELPYFSKRWLMKNKLHMSDEEINEMEAMWLRENPDLTENVVADSIGQADAPGLESVGISGGGDDFSVDDGADFGGDEAMAMDDGSESPISGSENATPSDEENPL